MSFTFFSIENSISNIKHIKKFTKNKKKKKELTASFESESREYLGRNCKRYQGHGSAEPCSDR